jgi:hypothetical protein
MCQEIQAALTAKYGKPEVSARTQCPLKLNKEEPCTVPSAFYDYWPVSVPPRQDKIIRVNLFVFALPMIKNDRGEKVTAGCHDPRARLAGHFGMIYTFEDFEKYEEEIKRVL